jgi:hypothetical protein
LPAKRVHHGRKLKIKQKQHGASRTPALRNQAACDAYFLRAAGANAKRKASSGCDGGYTQIYPQKL